MIIFLRSSDIGIDSKLRRYCKALRIAGIAHMALYWDRNATALGDDAIASIRYTASDSYGSKLRTGLKLLGLNVFALWKMWKNRGQIRLVHAIDLDTAIAAWLFKRLTGIPYIYDVYDHYPDSRGLTGALRTLAERAEKAIIADAARVILADEARVQQHPPIAAAKRLIIENVADMAQSDVTLSTRNTDDQPIVRIGYLGTLEAKFRGLEDIIAVVQDAPKVQLHIAGAGSLEKSVATAAWQSSQIYYYGPMDHHSGLDMLARCDVLLGLYYADVPNHRFAAPNKYYEHLLLGRPLLTSQATPPGDKVSAYDTGLAIEDGPEAIRQALAKMVVDRQGLRRQGDNAAALWRAQYADYFKSAISGHYIAAVRDVTDLSQQPASPLKPSKRRRTHIGFLH